MRGASFALLLPVVAATCPDGWQPWGGECYGIVGRATHRNCDALCAEQQDGATLACPQTLEDSNFLGEMLVAAHFRYAWLGQYQWPVDQGMTVGWDKCTSGVAANDTLYPHVWHNWESHNTYLAGWSDKHGMEDCVAMDNGYRREPILVENYRTSIDTWYSMPCAQEYPCICGTGGGTTSDEYLAVADEIARNRAVWDVYYPVSAEYRLRAWISLTLWVIVMMLPTVFWHIKGLISTLASKTKVIKTPTTEVAPSTTAQNTTSMAETEAEIRARESLGKALRASATIRQRVTRTLMQVGWSALILNVTPCMLPLLITKVSTPGLEDERVFDWFSPFMLYGVLIMFLSVGPTDVRATSIASVGLFTFPTLMLMIMVPFMVAEIGTPEFSQRMGDWRDSVGIMVFFPMMLFMVLTMVPSLPCGCCCPVHVVMPPRKKLRRIWLVCRVAFFLMNIMGIFEKIFTEPNGETDGKANVIGWFNNISGAILILLATRANRGRVTRFLGSLGSKSGDDEVQKSAAVASLVGGLSPERALATAQSRFRTLPLEAVFEEDLRDNTDTGMYARTSPAKLGAADGFISHSWHDHGPEKFAALKEWGETVKEWGDADRQTLIWLDKVPSATELDCPSPV